MTFQDYIAASQSAAITIAFIYLTYLIPGMFRDWMVWKSKEGEATRAEDEKMRQVVSSEREAERRARHATAETFSEAVAQIFINNAKTIDKLVERMHEDARQMTAAITELRITSEHLCRYNKDEDCDTRGLTSR